MCMIISHLLLVGNSSASMSASNLMNGDSLLARSLGCFNTQLMLRTDCSTDGKYLMRLLSCKELQSDPGLLQVLESAKAVFVDGYTFDELPAGDVAAALKRAHSAGAAVILDPGPRASDLLGIHQGALLSILDCADVVLMNEVRAVDCCYQHRHHM